jgi:ribonuclease HI
MKRKKTKAIKKTEIPQPIVFHTDGSGARPDGKGSAIAWIRADTGEEYVETVDGLTNNQAEYRAIISAVEYSPIGSSVNIFSDSQLVIYQISGRYCVRDPDLEELRNRVIRTVFVRSLEASFQWIPRDQNRADKLLRQHKAQGSSAKPEAAA